MRNPDQEFFLPPLRSHIVYAFYDDDRRPLYVGLSKIGLTRPFMTNHKMNGRGVILKVWFCDSEYAAIELESEMISILRPHYNINMNNRDDPPTPKQVHRARLVSVEKLSHEVTKPVIVRERLPGHAPGCGCDPDDWLGVVPDFGTSDMS